MGANSLIEWTWQRVEIARIDSESYRLALEIGAVKLDDATILVPGYTFNPWIGCTKVDELCAHCYAADLDKMRYSKILDGASKANPKSHWGPGAPRHRTSEANWRKVRQWNDVSGRLGIRQRVFCASLADWLDDDGVPIGTLVDLADLIRSCTNLDWLLLTKRPENWRDRIGAVKQEYNRRSYDGDPLSAGMLLTARWADSWLDGEPPENVWVGTSVGHQKSADKRIPELLSIPARVRFLSCEPMLGPVDLTRVEFCANTRQTVLTHTYMGLPYSHSAKIDWVICGGESGPGARPMHPKWAQSLRDQCAAAGVPFLYKQWGEWLPVPQGPKHETKNAVTTIGPEGTYMERVGKSAAGRLLDGVEHNGSPEVRHA